MAAVQEIIITQESINQGNTIKMEEQESAGSKPEEEMEEADGLTVGRTTEVLSRESPQPVKQEPEEEPSRNWDAQLEEFLKTLQTPCSSGDGPQLPEPRQWTDCKTSPELSEGVIEATKWPGGLWVSQSQPVSIGKVKQDRDVTCGGKEKEIVQTGAMVGVELRRQHFRKLRYQEAEGPRETCRQLLELCHQWLRPARHTKEQILDLLTLEQFLAILPPEMQCWLRENNPENCIQAVSLAEEFLQAQQGAKGWERQVRTSPSTNPPPPGCFPREGALRSCGTKKTTIK